MIPSTKHEPWVEKEPSSSENKSKRREEHKGNTERAAMESQIAKVSAQDELDRIANEKLVAVNFQPVSWGFVINFKSAKHFCINISTKRQINCEAAELILNQLDIKGQIRDALLPLVEAAEAGERKR